jgi:hypothetical protein
VEIIEPITLNKKNITYLSDVSGSPEQYLSDVSGSPVQYVKFDFRCFHLLCCHSVVMRIQKINICHLKTCSNLTRLLISHSSQSHNWARMHH